MPNDEVIELSVDETNALRAKLGLAPLRLGKPTANTSQQVTTSNGDGNSKEVLELSIEETNSLRKNLGLAPLRVSDKDEKKEAGKSSREALHRPAENIGDKQRMAEEAEQSKLKLEVERGIESKFTKQSLGEDEEETSMSWAAKMRRKSNEQKQKQRNGKKNKSKKKSMASSSLEQIYDERDLEGMNVSHAMSELEAGSTTVLTLADTSLLKTRDDNSSKVVGLNDESQTLQNVELAERQVQQEGLRKKRQVELGMGHAGGYAGFDDDEFEELGGSQGPSQLQRGLVAGGDLKKTSRGFKIGSSLEKQGGEKDDLFAFEKGKAISLDPSKADVTASDFMTTEEDAIQKKSKKRKDTKFKKKKKKKKKDRHSRRKDAAESEEEDDESKQLGSKGLLETLEETAVSNVTGGRKRRRSNSDEEDAKVDKSADNVKAETVKTSSNEDSVDKRAKFDRIMAKGNLRTAAAFEHKRKPAEASVEEELDDEFLNAALSKARRLKRLKEMSGSARKADDRIVQAVQSNRQTEDKTMNSTGSIMFAVDDTREFTRALRARAEQAKRKEPRQVQVKAIVESNPTEDSNPTTEPEDMRLQKTDDIQELAKEIKEDDIQEGGFDGTTSNAAPLGRGLAGVLSLLRHTGEISGKHAGKEELRGRSKDERTYEDYEALDLSNVVSAGSGNEKDQEFANREIKLEYRDEHGRLLTRKEAYRNLCYQFHGHGSSKKNEEKKLRQIARERAEGRLASRQVADGGSKGGTLGALKATQKATGRAFVVHKT